MKKIFIIFLFIIFSSSFSQANNKKISVEEIEDIFFNYTGKKFDYTGVTKEKKKDNETWTNYLYRISKESRESINAYKAEDERKRKERTRRYKEEAKENETWLEFLVRIEGPSEYWSQFEENTERKKTEEKRKKQLRGIAKSDNFAVIVQVVFARSEKGQKRRPGDIFYALEAIEALIYTEKNKRKYVKEFQYKGNKPVPGMRCSASLGDFYCIAFKRSTYKKIEKFKKDPSNEKVLGKKLIQYIKNIRMLKDMREKLGTDNYALVGDMLNDSVAGVKKNNISPDLQKRRVLLKKYSLKLREIKKKLDEDKYKSIDKDVSKLSKAYENLNGLKTTTNEMVMNIDEAVNIIFDINKFIQNSALNAKNNEEEKLLALASIKFMQSLIDSILRTIPDKYYVEAKLLNRDLFNDSDLKELDIILDNMIKKNKETKFKELNNSMDIIDEFINPSVVVKKLNNLGITNKINEPFTQDIAAEIAKQELRDNLDKDILKVAKEIIQNLEKDDGLDELTKEVSDVAKEISQEISKKTSTAAWATTKPGNYNIKHLIQASREGKISWDIGRR